MGMGIYNSELLERWRRVKSSPSAKIFVAFCSEIPLICSSILRGLMNAQLVVLLLLINLTKLNHPHSLSVITTLAVVPRPTPDSGSYSMTWIIGMFLFTCSDFLIHGLFVSFHPKLVWFFLDLHSHSHPFSPCSYFLPTFHFPSWNSSHRQIVRNPDSRVSHRLHRIESPINYQLNVSGSQTCYSLQHRLSYCLFRVACNDHTRMKWRCSTNLKRR